MLQAREIACILILISGLAPTGAFSDQDEPSADNERQIQRLGDSPVENELQLELTVPVQDEKPQDSDRPPDPAVLRQQAVERNLAAGDAAMKAGRVSRPARDSAWTHYRSALELDPGNIAAQRGLLAVQEAMVERALAHARELDFETAARMLDDATLVRENQEPVERGREGVREIRQKQVEKLEFSAVQSMDSGRFDEAERRLIELIALGDADSAVSQLRRRLEEARIYGGFGPGQIIRDHFINEGLWSPESVVVVAGSYTMGSSAFEDGRLDTEGPEHRVTIRRGFAIGRTEVTVGQFRTFVEKTRYRSDAFKQGYSLVYDHSSGRLARRDGVTWEKSYEGREASEDEPVVHVSWNDAMSYVQWLARGTGKPYRLLTEAEFEYALRGGRKSRYWWGDGSPRGRVENLTGEHDVSRSRRAWTTFFEGYEDGYWGPAPVGSFESNPFGIKDLGGNVAEWVRDCWHDTYIRAPSDGSAWINPGCRLRVIRGGYWASSPNQARSAFRLSAEPDSRDARIGFRIARDL